jgi:ribosomal subunit interface protein
MKTLIQAKNMKPTQALRSFIQDQVSKLQRLGLPINRVRVFLENIARKDSDPHRASVQMEVSIPRKGKVTVQSRTHDLYLGIVEATSSLMRHVRKEKEKRVDHSRRLQRRIKNGEY